MKTHPRRPTFLLLLGLAACIGDKTPDYLPTSQADLADTDSEPAAGSGDDSGDGGASGDDGGSGDDGASGDDGGSGDDGASGDDGGSGDDAGAGDDGGSEDGSGDDSDTGDAILPMPDFSLDDLNPSSATYGQPVSPRDLLAQTSGWYFTHST